MIAPTACLVLPAWAVASDKRRAHIARVTALLDGWAGAMALDAPTRAAWHDAGAWHDALRDAAEDSLGPPAVDPTLPPGAWHGPAAAERLRAGGESRADVLSAITWHTVGCGAWESTGHALYCADFLEPGRPFLRVERAELASAYAEAPRRVLRDVVRLRLDLAIRERAAIHRRTVELWDDVR